jgi:hypothetical protein
MSSGPYLFHGGWQVPGSRSAERFFESLGLLIPLPTYLCLEGAPEPDVRELIEDNSVPGTLQIPSGTIWSWPRKEQAFHVLATQSLLTRMSGLAKHHAAPEICTHIHAYNSAKIVLLHWYDAFLEDSPLLVDASVPESAVKRFCHAIQVTYDPWTEEG